MEIGQNVTIASDSPQFGFGGTHLGEVGTVVHREIIRYRRWFRIKEELFWVGVDFPSRHSNICLAVSPDDLREVKE